MNKRIFWLAFAVAALAVLVVNCAWTAPYYAVAAGTSKLYMVGTESSAPWSNQLYHTLVNETGASFSGIAVSGSTIYAADAASNSLFIYSVEHENGVPVSATQVKQISLAGSGSNQFIGPTELVLDASGGVYVLGTAYMDQEDIPHHPYQYLKPSSTAGWDSPTRTIYELNQYPMVDIATYGFSNGAVVLHTSIADGEPGYPSLVSQLIGGPKTITTRLDPGMDPGPNQQPVAIAVHPGFGSSGYAYIVNGATAAGPGGSLTVLNPESMNKQGDTVELPDDFIPEDIAAFTVNVDSVTRNYLAIVGHYSAAGPGTPSIAEAWRVELDQDGRPLMNSIVEIGAGGSLAAAKRYLGPSGDGLVTWMTGSSPNGVVALDNTSAIWKQLVGVSISDVDQSIRRISHYAVPEPSSLVSVLALAGAATALVRRRRI